MPSKKAEVKKGALALLGNMAPVLVFYGVNHFYGLRPAVVTTILFTFAEIIRFRVQKRPLNKVFLFAVGMTLVFSVLDLIYAKGVFVKLEPVITNLVTAGFFAYLIKSPGMLKEMLEQAGKADALDSPEALFLVRINMAIWVLYFVGKSAVYLQYNLHHTVEQTLIFRTTVGNASLVGILAVSFVATKMVRTYMVRSGRWVAVERVPRD
jgi:intracellular septation protein A